MKQRTSLPEIEAFIVSLAAFASEEQRRMVAYDILGHAGPKRTMNRYNLAFVAKGEEGVVKRLTANRLKHTMAIGHTLFPINKKSEFRL